MVIIQNYTLEPRGDTSFSCKSREESHCLHCRGKFKVIGSRRRVLYQQDGSCIFLVVRRLRCLGCKKISHELPDIVVPYKRHEADTIACRLAGNPLQKAVCCPAESSTMNRWKHWFFYNQVYFEKSLLSIKKQTNRVPYPFFPLSPLNRQPEGWLRHLIYHLVNFDFWKQTRSA